MKGVGREHHAGFLHRILRLHHRDEAERRRTTGICQRVGRRHEIHVLAPDALPLDRDAPSDRPGNGRAAPPRRLLYGRAVRQNTESLVGRAFARLTVLRVYRTAPGTRSRAVCRCECGRETDVQTNNLTSGNTTSCGCLGQQSRARNGRANRRHGHAANDRESGTYASWRGMLKRCERPVTDGFRHYGGRGISVCTDWRTSFDAFLADMGARPDGRTLDRIDSNRGYSKDNCRWSTVREQNRNKRNTYWVVFAGSRISLADLTDRLGFRRFTLRNRLKCGWSIERAAATPERTHV